MHLRNVELFCDVVTRHSFSKAAEANQVSQSAVSQAAHMLEERLGTLLIDRSKRPLELTAAGEIYFEGCRRLLAEFRELDDRVRRLGNRVAGRVRIAAIYSIGLLQMHGHVRRYRALYPDVELSVEYLHPDEVYERVLNDDADLGMVSFPRAGGEIASIAWRKEPMVVVVWPEHPLADRESVSVGELDGQRFVAFSFQLTIRKKIARWLRQARVSVNVVHEFDNIEYIKRAVEIGSGITVLPVPTLRRELESGTLVAIPFRDVEWY
ncbi:MAG TPA: LysR family transcriptional regulator, partial [Planctomycetaceae bacterium]|nr:LysR family transcriptional regulator [Planctomycetaceae bacterium]